MTHESGVSRDHLEHDAMKMSEAEFGAAHPGPFLTYDVPQGDEDLDYLTELPNRPATRKNVAVAAIRRRDGGSGEVTVGRALECDVPIRVASVSKLHAHFRRDEGAWSVTDLGSHNGTAVDGAVLVAHGAAPVRVGSAITFGTVTVRVIDVHAAYELLRR